MFHRWNHTMPVLFLHFTFKIFHNFNIFHWHDRSSKAAKALVFYLCVTLQFPCSFFPRLVFSRYLGFLEIFGVILGLQPRGVLNIDWPTSFSQRHTVETARHVSTRAACIHSFHTRARFLFLVNHIVSFRGHSRLSFSRIFLRTSRGSRGSTKGNFSLRLALFL